MMAVPKATVNEYYLGASGEDQVWFAWEIFDVKSITIALRVQQTSHDPFGRSILPLNCLHRAPAKLFRRFDHLMTTFRLRHALG
jgi:hypothetical protein